MAREAGDERGLDGDAGELRDAVDEERDKGGVREANFSEVKLGSTNDFAASAKLPEAGEQKITVTGRAIDASQLFKSLGKSKSEQPDSAVKASKPLSITAQIREVTLKGGAVLKDLSFKHQSDGVNMRGLEVSGEFAGGGGLRADLAVQADGRRKLRVTTGNAGRLLGALTEFNSMLGGRLSVSADLAPLPPPGAKSVDAPPRFSGVVKVEQFKVTDQPFLARLFAAGSFTGLGDLLSGGRFGQALDSDDTRHRAPRTSCRRHHGHPTESYASQTDEHSLLR
jgi:hypothetical protein